MEYITKNISLFLNLFYFLKNLHIYSLGTSRAPLLMSSIKSCGALPSMVHPTLCAVPRISLHVPCNSLAIDRGRIVRAIARISSNVIFPLCLTRNKKQYVKLINSVIN